MDPSNNFRPQSSRSSTLFVWATAIFFFTIFGFLFVLDRMRSDLSGGGRNQNSPYGGSLSRIAETNAPYREALFARRDRQYSRAMERFEVALTQATSDDERAQIEYEIGNLYSLMRNSPEGIRVFKRVAGNTSYPPLLRAYAVQAMGQIFYSRHEEAVFEQIFEGRPYFSLLVSGDVDLSLKNLFEYASSFYPLMYAELRVANWYANELLKVRDGGTARVQLSSQEMQDLVRQKLENADRDIEQVKSVYPTDSRVSSALQRKAIILDKMERLGNREFGDPEPVFKDAIEKGTVWGYTDQVAYTEYHYAVYLAYVHPERRVDIVSLLQHFYGPSNRYSGSIFFDFIRNERNNLTGAKTDLLLLASIDGGFKEMLELNGWTF